MRQLVYCREKQSLLFLSRYDSELARFNTYPVTSQNLDHQFSDVLTVHQRFFQDCSVFAAPASKQIVPHIGLGLPNLPILFSAAPIHISRKTISSLSDHPLLRYQEVDRKFGPPPISLIVKILEANTPNIRREHSNCCKCRFLRIEELVKVVITPYI